MRIQTGRYARNVEERSVRHCMFCVLNDIEDEYHFVMEYVMYTDMWKIYIGRNYWFRPSMAKFVDLIKSENENILRNLGTYIHKAFIIRNEVMYRN